jgi:hypothetical protein
MTAGSIVSHWVLAWQVVRSRVEFSTPHFG